MAAFTDPERRDELFGQIRGMRKDTLELKRSVKCLHDGMNKFTPMLTEMMETRARMRILRWSVYTAAAVGGVGGLFLMLKFVGLLILEWAKKQLWT